MDYVNKYKILSEAQYGFRKGHSTTTCTLSLLDNIYAGMEHGQLTGVVFLDLKKAFDMVNHKILMKKLQKYGFNYLTVKWFESYLTGRYQCVKVMGVWSGELVVRCGVPQGSILGPLLFSLYINDLPEYLENTLVSLYADDTALYYQNESYVDIILNMRIELETVKQWPLLNKLTLNVKKTKFVIFGSKYKLRQVDNLKLYIDGEEIERVNTFKYLGLMLDCELNFESHISYTYRKACSKLTLL